MKQLLKGIHICGGYILKKYLIVFLVCSKFAFSADQQPASASNGQNEGPQASPTSTNDQSQLSAENRKELKYQTTLSFIGADYSGFRSNFTLGVGYFIDDNDLINLRYTFQNSSGAEQSRSSNDFPEKTRAIALGDRHFFGNSFNTLGSLYWKDHSKFDRANGRTYYFKDYGLGIRLGNEWQWKNFTMGCDWFGLNHSLVKVADSFPATSFGLDRELTFSFLNFYLGYSF